MTKVTISRAPEVADGEWMTFPGGELEGRQPRTLCPACREQLRREAGHRARAAAAAQPKPLCFQCYRADLARERALQAAGEINTASDARFQCTLPFEPVNRARLARLRGERAAAGAGAPAGAGPRRRPTPPGPDRRAAHAAADRSRVEGASGADDERWCR